MRFLLFTALFALHFLSFGQDDKIYIVLFAGQSNMAGRGQYQSLSQEDKQKVEEASKYISIINGEKQPVPLSYIRADKRQTNFGPELFAGILLHEKYPDRKFFFIKEAKGGTSLYGAWNPEWSYEKAKIGEIDDKRQQMKLYSRHVETINKTLERIKSDGKIPVLMGMCWMQGEKDSRLETTATAYGENFQLLIKSYRQTFNHEKMPFIFGQINCPPRTKFPDGTEVVRQQMAHIAKNDQNIFMINTSMNKDWDDFPKRGDNVHYNTQGQKKLGTAFGDMLIQNSHY
ncbi:sialate O-acetylesterase [Flammeovirga sp. SubArs3]|uniref:sialate O-acetylesterase n=1 Tax=Flammeovirga sp. SubArs3 TaxID=2995316 RepID=UPI00248BA08C|nr:sialate O-acetylesterase [Flammeovirga sp. SubArs3]